MDTEQADYEQIRQQNLRDHGVKRDWWQKLLTLIYSHRSHFILELLQNAEDAHHPDGRGASKIEFVLERDRLLVFHDGRPFSDRDTRAICDVGFGTKSDDVDTIGKFGIGFKSVFAYTTEPRVHSPPHHFRIEDFIDPHALAESAIPEGSTTKFEFPFDRKDTTATAAYAEIRGALRALTPRTLLFLRHLDEICWTDADGRTGRLARTIDDSGVTALISGQKVLEEWVRFEVVPPAGLTGGRPVELAFLLEKDSTGGRWVVPASHTTVVTYFPTKRPTRFGFLIQAPFDVTPSREELREDAEVNSHIVEVAAELLPDALESLRDRGWLRGSSLEALPLSPRKFPKGDLFAPMMASAKRAMRERALLPRHSGGWGRADELRFPVPSTLRALLNHVQLSEVSGEDANLFWLDSDISKESTPSLYECLLGYTPKRTWEKGRAVQPLVPDMKIGLRRILQGMSPDFLERQTEEWLIELYVFLGAYEASREEIRSLPLVRLESGAHVPAFSADGKPAVWLPPSGTTSFPILKRSLAEHPEARMFLRSLGVSEPDLVDDVVKSALPDYETIGPEISRPGPEAHEENLKQIADALGSASSEKRKLLLEALRSCAFIRARPAGTKKVVWEYPEHVYRCHDSGFAAFACGNPSINMLAEDDVRHASIWDALGLSSGPRVSYRRAGLDGHVKLVARHGHHERGRDGFDPALGIRGLERALREPPTLEKSLYIWRLVCRYSDSLAGVVETSTRQDFLHAKQETQLSEAGRMLVEAAWLPDQNGRFLRPAEIGLEELPESFPRNTEVSTALGMLEPAAREDIARTFGLEQDDVAVLLEHRSELARVVEEIRKRKARRADPSGERDQGEPVSTPEHIAARQRTAAKEHVVDAPLPSAGPKTEESVRDAAKRSRAIPEETRLEVRRHIQKSLGGQAAAQKEEATMEVLADYNGRCQVCQRTFVRAGGGHGCSVIQWQSAVASRGATFAGNLLLVCAWHAALLASARFTLLGSNKATEDDLIELVKTAEASENVDGERSYSVPIFFHNVADTNDASTETKRETIRFAEAHWLSFKLCLLGEES